MLKRIIKFIMSMRKLKIAIISGDDKLWSLYAWNNVFRSQSFIQEYDCAGFWICNQKFSNKKKASAWYWYLKTFRFWNFFKLFSFVVSFKIFSFIKSLAGKYQMSFSKLCKTNKIPFFKTPNPNDASFIEWVKANEIDIVLIMVDYILKKDILNAPKICVVNKHAGFLPMNKGLFPYFWAKLSNQLQGISFHKANEKIDEGDLYYQEKVESKEILRSMITFYFYVHKNYHLMLNIALENVLTKTIIPLHKDLPGSYHSLPEAADYITFKNNGGKIINWQDIFLPFELLKN